MEKKQYIRPASVSIELHASEMCAESTLSASSLSVDATDARVNDRLLNDWEELDDVFDF